MRIVHVTDAYLPKVGGIEVQVRDLAMRQAAQGHDVHVVTRAPGSTSWPGASNDGPAVARVLAGYGPRGLALTQRRLEEALSGADMVQAHLSVLSPLALLAIRTSVRQGRPVAATCHSVLGRRSPIAPLLRRASSRADAVAWCAVSEVAAGPLRAALGPAAEVELVPNGLDLAPWREVAATRSRRHPHRLNVAAVGRLAHRKRPVALVKVVARAQRLLEAQGSQVRLELSVAGDGPMRAAVRAAATLHGIEGQVHLLGTLGHQDLRELLRRSDAFLAAARQESFGIAALEARASGLPIVALRGTGIAEILSDRIEGLMASSDAGLADALVSLAQPGGLWSAIADHNCRYAPEYGWAETLHRTDLAYKRADALVTSGV